MHLPSLLSSKKHLQEHLPIYWAAWQQLQNIDSLEIAAELGHVPAQLELGLRLAKLDTSVDEVINTVEVKNKDAFGGTTATTGITTLASGATIQIEGANFIIPEPITISGTGVSVNALSQGAIKNIRNK
jgi:hypothetical protein